MKKYVDYRDNGETEERVQITQATCQNEEEIPQAIEKAKRELKETSVPYGYRKLDEEIITTVYKIPGNEIIHEIHESNTRDINEKYSLNNKYENKREYKYYNSGNNEPFPEEGTIYNYNTVTKNHGYYEGEPIQKNTNTYQSKYKQYNITNTRNRDGNEIGNTYTSINEGKIENYFENQISKDGQYLVSMTLSKKIVDGNNYRDQGRYRNKFYRKEMEIDENDGVQNDYGNNNINEYYEKNEETNRIKYYPIRSERKIGRYYESDNVGRDKNFNKITNSQAQSFQFPAQYKHNDFHYYNQ